MTYGQRILHRAIDAVVRACLPLRCTARHPCGCRPVVMDAVEARPRRGGISGITPAEARAALESAEGNVSRAAVRLGIARSTLRVLVARAGHATRRLSAIRDSRASHGVARDADTSNPSGDALIPPVGDCVQDPTELRAPFDPHPPTGTFPG